MIVGCPAEIKVRENRVGIVPASAKALTAAGHKVLVERGAGLGSGISDEEYQAAGAQILQSAEDIWQQSEMIVKVKEPIQPEFKSMRPGQIVFTFLHLAAEAALTRALTEKQVNAVAYETIQVGHTLPLLKPSSEVAGRMAIQVGAWCLEKQQGGKGQLLSGVTGVPKSRVTILGGGVAGSNAARIALGMGAEVTILDTSLERLEFLEQIFQGNVQTLFSTAHNIADSVCSADLVVGAVLIAGARAPKLVTRDHVSQMTKGSVIVDISIDQGGCIETMKPTTHDDPIFLVDGVVHYGVTNMPGAVARTSTFALSHATLPFMRMIADLGLEKSCKSNPSLAKGLNTYRGHITFKAVADAHGAPFVEQSQLF